MSSFNASWCLVAAISIAVGCSQNHSASTPTAADHKDREPRSFAEAFPSDQLLEIALELRDDDWEKVRSEGRTLNEVYSGCTKPYDYTLMPAQATIDGRAHGQLQVRKKGFIGSLSKRKPSLRLELGDDPYRDQPELTLNNNFSDSTLMHQCLAYSVFTRAGLAAPQCAFASVSVNGERLGTYTNVEPIKRGLLERHFGSADGNLYESSALADFRDGALDHFERKNNRQQSERTELDAVAAALELADDDEMLAAVEPLLDLEKFIRFWAVEVLVGHWDGYAGNINNVYLYVDPGSKKLFFIPWGADQAFEKTHPNLPFDGRPPVTLAFGRLTRRLYAYDATRARYYAQLRELLGDVWDEASLHGEIDRMYTLLGGAPDPAAVEALRSFVDTRREQIEQELSADPVPWTIPERVLDCSPQFTSKITGTFSTTWGTLDTPVAGPGASFEVDVNLQHRSEGGLSAAGPVESEHAAVRVISGLGEGRYLVVHLELPSLPRELPADIELHGFETFGVLVLSEGAAQTTTIGYIGDGAIHFDRASTEQGAEVSGRFEAHFSQVAELRPPN
jgi:hypothetical protein